MLSTQSYEPPPADTGRDAAGAAGPCRHRVLLVEEDRALLESYTDLLLGNGYDVAVACSSRAAERLLRARGTLFDAVLVEATAAGRASVVRAASEAGPGVPVILVPGGACSGVSEASGDTETAVPLVRPSSNPELLRCVENLTRLRRLGADPSHAEISSEGRHELETRMTRALERLYMTYQPIIRVRDGSVFGWEALLRTDEPTLPGALPFLELGERLGRVRELSRTVRGSVARTAGKVRGFMFFVNLHHDDLLDEELYAPGSALAICAAEVVLEITERRPIEGVPGLAERLARLRRLGFRIALDDLGAGYSGLDSLALLQPDFVKLDRGLVAGLHQDAAKRQRIASILDLCRDSGQTVIAEGVEKAAERSALSELGCDLMQGFFFRAAEDLRLSGEFAVDD